jgi:FeS assembly SUF system protein
MELNETMGILKIDDVPPPLGAGELAGDRPAGAWAVPSSGGQPVIPPHVDGSAPPPQASPMSPLPAPDGPPSSSMFDTSALTGSSSAAPAGQAAASPSTSAPPIDPDPVRTLELKPQIVEQLSTVFDPEIPVNIYELGLIYDVAVDGKGLAVIQMTLTAPGCPAAITLPAEVQGKVKSIEGVSDARVDLVWEPPWDKDRMSDAAKLQLGIFD